MSSYLLVVLIEAENDGNKMDQQMTENSMAIKSKNRKEVNKRSREKGKQEKENQQDKLKFRGLVHNFNFICVHDTTYKCTFNIKLKFPPTYNGGTGKQGGCHHIRCSWWQVCGQEVTMGHDFQEKKSQW